MQRPRFQRPPSRKTSEINKEWPRTAGKCAAPKWPTMAKETISCNCLQRDQLNPVKLTLRSGRKLVYLTGLWGASCWVFARRKQQQSTEFTKFSSVRTPELYYHCTQKDYRINSKIISVRKIFTKITEDNSQSNSVRDSVILCSHYLTRRINSRNKSVR